MRCIAVPVYAPTGMVVAAVSVSNAAARLPNDQIPLWGTRLVHLSRTIGESLDTRRG